MLTVVVVVGGPFVSAAFVVPIVTVSSFDSSTWNSDLNITNTVRLRLVPLRTIRNFALGDFRQTSSASFIAFAVQ